MQDIPILERKDGPPPEAPLAVVQSLRVHAGASQLVVIIDGTLGRLATARDTSEDRAQLRAAYDVIWNMRESVLEAIGHIEKLLRPGNKFGLGRLVMTPGAMEVFGGDADKVRPFIDRHVNGDWGDLDDEDKRTNDTAVKEGMRILSAYHHDGQKLWVITEADRSSTTVLTPDEY